MSLGECSPYLYRGSWKTEALDGMGKVVEGRQLGGIELQVHLLLWASRDSVGGWDKSQGCPTRQKEGLAKAGSS